MGYKITQEDLKLLAEWHWGEAIKEINIVSDNLFVHLKSGYGEMSRLWQPHKDSNQLDMLEDKMTEELGRLEMDLVSDGVRGVVIARHCYVKDGEVVYVVAEGKIKNEARLRAILNYVKEKK